MTRLSRPATGIVLAAVTLLLAGCASPGTPSPTGSSAPASTAPVASPPVAAPSSNSAPTAPPIDPDAPAGQCANDSLAVSVVESDAGMGSIYYQVNFTNTGTTDCELRGFPGVSVVGDGNGTQLGAPADQQTDGPAPETYTIAPGDTIGALLQAVNIAIGGGPLDDACQVVTGDGWRIYPPHSFDAVFVAAPGVPACANTETVWLSISPLSAA
jgi:hypothetical protein